MLIPLVFVALTAAPASVDPIGKLQHELADMRQHELDESSLLNLQVKLPALNTWDSTQNAWQSAEVHENLGGSGNPAKLRIVHFWAPWCEPCKREFTTLKQIDQNMRTSYKKDVDFIYISVDTSDPDGMQKYMIDFDARMPVGLKYGDGTHELTALLEQAMPQTVQRGQLHDPAQRGRRLPLPMTLVLDRDDMVRQVFVGSIDGRRGEFANGAAKLLRWAKEREVQEAALCAKEKVARRPQGRQVQ